MERRRSSLDRLDDMLPIDLFDPAFMEPATFNFPSPSSIELRAAMQNCIPGPLFSQHEPMEIPEGLIDVNACDLIHLDSYELENLCEMENVNYSLISEFNADSSNMGAMEFDPGYPFNCSTPHHQPEMSYNENQSFALNQQPAAPSEQNLLLVSIPKHLSESSAFDSFPTVQLNSMVINQIMEASAGYDGAFLPPVKPNLHEEKIVRRPPIRIIQQQIVQSTAKSEHHHPQVNCKRKQQFNYTRDDRVVFCDDTISVVGRKNRKKIETMILGDDSLEWTDTASDEDSTETPAAVEKKCCTGCNKMFVKLNNHKCKMMENEGPKSTSRRSIGLELKCTVCKRIYRQHSSYKKHIESCAPNDKMMFCDMCGFGFKSKSGIRGHVKKCMRKIFAFEIKVPEMVSVEEVTMQEHLETVPEIVSVEEITMQEHLETVPEMVSFEEVNMEEPSEAKEVMKECAVHLEGVDVSKYVKKESPEKPPVKRVTRSTNKLRI